jgi:hypothetical protein
LTIAQRLVQAVAAEFAEASCLFPAAGSADFADIPAASAAVCNLSKRSSVQKTLTT